MILDKAGFNSRISSFFSNYLINRRTQYVWNNFTFSSFKTDVDISQSSILSLILSVLYIASIFHMFEKITKNFEKSNVNLFCSYSLNNSDSLSNTPNQRFFTFLG